ncbi:MAG TPA: peptidoglycan DD-metalloendopeptidase family protein [Stellaceae bacterium]|jgi:murein DD-endopeptidase MepM/ murein hydrolase activator NlpD|nr:peptidoglycan DD-metalloendopeptidase family protein [Stellaceae bacterium]
MIGNLMQKGAMRLPEIGFVAQPISSAVNIIRGRADRKQALLASIAGLAIIAVGFAAAGYVRHTHTLNEAQLATSKVETANIDLQDELAQLRDKIAASNRDLIAAQGRVATLTEEMRVHPQPAATTPAADATAAGKGSDKVSQLSQQLHVAEAERATLAARLSKAEADLAQQQAKQADLLSQLDQWQKKLQDLSADRDRLKARVGELERQSALRHAQPAVAAATPAPASAPATVAPAPAAPASAPAAPDAQAEPQRVAGVLNAPQRSEAPSPAAASAAIASAAGAVVNAPVVVAHGAVDQFARVLASAGVDVRHLFSEFGVNRDEGGPFVPAPAGATAPNTLSPEKLAALRAMVKTLPVSAPLAEYRITSPFGVRADPENDRAGFHTGVDLAAAYDTPVYSTAPGTVTFAGFRDDYGRIVEIDHGNGIATRYAHLHSFTVSVGEHVAAHQQVGYLGSSGRATGPHVHYEVVVNGEPQDPEKFMALGRYVQPMTTPVSARN